MKNCLYRIGRPICSKTKKKTINTTHKEISAGGGPGYRILLIRMKKRNIMHNVVFLHTTTVAEEIHLVYLPLVFRLHLLLLSCKASPKFIHLFLELKILLLHSVDLTLQGFLFPLQCVRLSPDKPFFLLQSRAQLLNTAQMVGDESTHSLHHFQPLEKMLARVHHIVDAGYNLDRAIMKQNLTTCKEVTIVKEKRKNSKEVITTSAVSGTYWLIQSTTDH